MTDEASRHIREGDRLLREGAAREPQHAYQAAWPHSKSLGPRGQVWLLVSIAHASLRAGDFDEAFNACAAAQQHFARSSGIVAGNPLFHLFAGLAAHGLNEARTAQDNLARALICGGPALFTAEAPEHLATLRELLSPPAELGTGDGYVGCSLDQLNSLVDFRRRAARAAGRAARGATGQTAAVPAPSATEVS